MRTVICLALTWSALTTAATPSSAADAEPRMSPVPLIDGNMLVGVDYYPEHWPETRWETDINLMREAGFNVVRLAEFSWALCEPTEGTFDFSWLDRFLDLAQKKRLRVILGTPTAVMPAWLARRYPEALAMKANGVRTVWGGRRHNCFSDSSYRRLAERIADKMAERYASHPMVLGWQIDNELGGTDCRCEPCRIGFQNALRRKYETLDALNLAWGNRFWGLNFSDWDEIPIPDDRVGKWAISNPSACLDWQRFTSQLNVEFLDAQVEIVRKRIPASHFITHNLMGLHQGVNYYDLANRLDFVSWDNYPQLHPEIPYSSSLAADLMRGLKNRNFLIMEQTAGPLGWETYSRTPQPGELRKICYQQLAHGADGQIWFRWRTCPVGREQYWHGLLGHDGKPGRRYREAARVATEYQQLSSALAGTTVRNQVAVIYDYDSAWALQFQPGYLGAAHTAAIQRYHLALFRAGVGVDVVRPGAKLDGYRLVLAPHLHVLSDAVAEQLVAYVKEGGVLLADCRTGVKDLTNRAYERTLPGLLSRALGIEINEYESLRLGIGDESQITYKLSAKPLARDVGDEGSYTAQGHADWITTSGAETMASYDEPHLRDYAAATRFRYGSGWGWYVGTVVQEEAFYDALIARVLADAHVAPIKLPQGVEASIRTDQQHSYLFLINHTAEKQTVPLVRPGRDLLSDEKLNDSASLAPFGVAVIAQEP